jgi:hypothetical protein
LEQSTPELKDTYISRLGGEEFGVILRDVGSEETERIGRNIADNIRSQTFLHNSDNITVTISGGVVHYPSDAEITNDIFKKADNACYKSKVLGKDRVTYSRNVVDLESASKYHITKEFKDELGDIYDSFEIHEFLRQITIEENGQAALNERRILTQKDAEANGFPVIVMSDGEVSGWDSTKANIKYVSRDGDNCWIVGLEIPEYIQETNSEYEVDFNCSLGNAYSEHQETHVTDLTLYEPPVRIDDTFEFPDERAVQDAWIEEYSTEEEEFVELQSGTVSSKQVAINEGDLSVALEVKSTPSILRTVWEW